MTTIYYSRARERALITIDEPRAGAWVVVTAPDETELENLAQTYKLDKDILTDALDIYEAPRIEHDDQAVYIFLRYSHPEGGEVATEPLLLVYTSGQLLTIGRRQTSILTRLVSGQIDVVTTQKTKTLLQIFAEVNRSYELQMRKAGRQILQLRAHLRSSELNTREFVASIELEEDLNEFLAALQPQALLLHSLLGGKYLRLYEEDRDIIEDIERGVSELIEQARGRTATLVNMRQAYDAIATNNLNKIFKRLTSIAIFLTVPTIVGGIWGMNVALPFEHARYAFLYVLAVMAVLLVALVWFFRRKKWL
jgi:magnesium transporter